MKKIWEHSVNENIESMSIAENKERVVLSTNKKICCFDFKGNKIWENKFNKKAKILTIPDGRIIIAIPVGLLFYMNTIVYFNENGKLLWKYKTPFGYRITDADTDKCGKNILVGVYDSIVQLNENGEIVMKRKFSNWKQLTTIHSVSVSGDGNFFIILTESTVVSYQSEIILFDKNGNELFRKRSEKNNSPYEIVFSNNSKYIAVRGAIGLGLNKGFLSLFDLRGNLLWKHSFDFVPREIDISENGEYIIAKREEDIFLFNIKGELLNEFKIENCKEVYSSKNGDKIFGCSDNKFWCYKI